MNWDQYFYNICCTVASNSKCLSRQIGAVLVRDKTVIGTGYNGPPRGVPSCRERYIEGIDPVLIRELKARRIPHLNRYQNDCPRKRLKYQAGEGLEWCVAGHAERNCLINSARLGILTFGADMYMNCGIPCKDCLIEMINAGINTLVVTQFQLYDQMSEYLLRHSSLKVRVYQF